MDYKNLINKNNKTIESKKSWKQDLFIHLRKVQSKIQNDFFVMEILKKLNDNKLMMLILAKISTSSPLKSDILDVMK
jgi:hypothetical protein